jgi:hypothetical protein
MLAIENGSPFALSTALPRKHHGHSDKGPGYVYQSTLTRLDTLKYLVLSARFHGTKSPSLTTISTPKHFVAKSSHGTWSSVGTFTYINAVILNLQNITSDRSLHWDSKDSITPLFSPPVTLAG